MQRNHLIYVNETGARGSEPTGDGPFVGIWWADGPTIAALLQTASSVSASLGMFDSDFEHWREWPSVCQHFHKTKGDEYFGVPRAAFWCSATLGED